MSNARELAELGGAYSTGGYPHFKNRIINGAMMIDQRNAGASVTANAGVFPIDRFVISTGYTSKANAQRSTVAPAGFTNSLLITSTAATSLSSGDFFSVTHNIEGFNTADLGFGTANAQPITISFRVRSSLTGTFGGSVQNAGNNRSYPFSYTITAANTWETKTVTLNGDTTGTWETGNGQGIKIRFALAMGSTYSGTAGAWVAGDAESATGAISLLATSGATWYITGFQLEKGSTATSFDYRPYGTEELLCKRYYTKFVSLGASYVGIGCGVIESATGTSIVVKYPVTMRSSPTAGYSTLGMYDGSAIRTVTALSTNYQGNDALNINVTASGGGMTVGRAATLITNGSTGYFDLSAEL